MRACLLTLLLCTAAAAAEPPPAEHFFQRPRFAAMALSPDGESIAALSPVNGRQNLVILDAKTKAVRPITGDDSRDIVVAQWVNAKRLMVRTGSLGASDFESRGGGLFAIDSDGKDGRLLSEGQDERSTSDVRLVWRALNVVRTLPGEGDDIIAQEFVWADQRVRAGGLFRVDTRSGRRTLLSVDKPDSGEIESWIVDARGTPRVLVAASKATRRVYYRADGEAPWKKLDESALQAPSWMPVAIDSDDKALLVSDQRGRDKAAIRRYDPATGSFGEVLAEHPQVDLREVVVDRSGAVVGIEYDADRGGAAWFDAQLARVQRDVDAALPGTVNRLSWSRDRARILVASRSDRSPGSFYLLDTKAGKLEWLVDRAPWIKPKEMAPMRPVRYAARDGLEIPAFVTLPLAGGKNLPLVVVVHGGPWVDGDRWGFDPEAQFLASRGYAVLQPNFRGTTRYGWKHLAASFGQWGLAMQDDIADGVKWAVEQGIADPKRVCIYGASYGGYATMMGLARHPELYRCGINYVGVTDLDLFLTATWADYAYSDLALHSVKEMVGDPSRDAERLKSTSPVHLAAKIRAPVLLAYGAGDARVPIEHGLRMRSALQAAGNPPEWLVAEGEGHGFRDPKNQKRFYETMEAFLKRSLATP